ncbi:ribosome maturation factor RimM [Segniliparus rugosus]|uniref:Ribosome maturation factor RimM n=1 Tax=Segniliparus rugosus (strain ATCC BAA-974 / DSM 45345 / CCUG 50838 / CIP 108380 / JCM 13579 / CDC 945) TaxID=679197 RepID=E5XSH8_SEGRC|nr:ribosome maturation factor RimM [Segniliparus rugosus]EFV12655.1 16S rRNA processing protein RimM [Segniliparus rugosus ATCC BAA-974]
MAELVVGRIAKSHGLVGEVAVEIRTDEPELRFAPGSALAVRMPKAKAAGKTLRVVSVREHANRLLVSFEGVVDRTAADSLRGALLVVRSEDLPPNEDPDEFYDHELVGLRIEDHGTGAELGEIADVAHSAGGDWLVARVKDGREVLIPFVAAIVVEISRSDRVARVALPEGLLELNAES